MKGKTMSPELLNEREREIVQRLATGLSDQQIADELFLSLNTVKWYNRQIYSKLGVRSRTQTIARVQDLGMLVSGAPTSQHPASRYHLPAQTLLFLGRNPFFLGREEVLTCLRRQSQAGQIDNSLTAAGHLRPGWSWQNTGGPRICLSLWLGLSGGFVDPGR